LPNITVTLLARQFEINCKTRPGSAQNVLESEILVAKGSCHVSSGSFKQGLQHGRREVHVRWFQQAGARLLNVSLLT
jgi:hypothetical protein